MRVNVRLIYYMIMEKKKSMPAKVDGNGAAAQKEESKFTKLMRIKRTLSICFNFIYIIAYMAFTVFTFAGDNAEITWLPYLFAGFILFYMVLFIVSLAMAKSDRRKQNTVKDYKSGLKIVKKLLKLVNLVLAIALVVNAVSGDRNLFSLIISCVSVVYVLYQIFAEIRKMIKRRKKMKIKEMKEECDNRFISDVKNIWNGEDKKQSEEVTEEGVAVSEPVSGELPPEGIVGETDGDSEAGNAPAVAAEAPAEVAVAEEKPAKKGVSAKISAIGRNATKKIDDVKKSAQDKVEAVKSTAEKAKKIGARAKEYYGERKKIDEEMSGKKKKKDTNKK